MAGHSREMFDRLEDAVHAEKSEDGDATEGQVRQKTKDELLRAAPRDEVEVDATNRPAAVRNRLVYLAHVNPLSEIEL